MSDTTMTNIPSALETRVKEPSDGAPPTTGIGGPSLDRFSSTKKILNLMLVKRNFSLVFQVLVIFLLFLFIFFLKILFEYF